MWQLKTFWAAPRIGVLTYLWTVHTKTSMLPRVTSIQDVRDWRGVWTDCTGAQAGMGLRCLCMPYAPFYGRGSESGHIRHADMGNWLWTPNLCIALWWKTIWVALVGGNFPLLVVDLHVFDFTRSDSRGIPGVTCEFPGIPWFCLPVSYHILTRLKRDPRVVI